MCQEGRQAVQELSRGVKRDGILTLNYLPKTFVLIEPSYEYN